MRWYKMYLYSLNFNIRTGYIQIITEYNCSEILVTHTVYCNYTGCNQPIVTCVVTLINLLYTKNTVGIVTPTS